VTSISSGESPDRKLSGVPQRGQKLRVPCSDDAKCAGSPAVIRKPSAGIVNQVTKGAALIRRQREQWQWVSWDGVPSTA